MTRVTGNGEIPLQRELEVATDLARRAGDVLLGYFRRDDLDVERKVGNEPVTAADRASEALVIDGLRHAFPDDVILSEEQADRTSWMTRRRAWLIDPLDGTKDFVAGRDGFSVMIGLLIDYQPVLGVVRQPVVGLTYRGARGLGAVMLRDGQPGQRLQPSQVSDPAAARLVASYSHRGESINQVKARLGITDEINVGSVGLKVGLVARGDRELYVNPEGHCRLWDICAPQAILVAAGGAMTDIHGAQLAYDQGGDVRVRHGIVASNGRCHRAVIEKLAPLFGQPG